MSTYLDKTASLTPQAYAVICEQATEYPHTGSYRRVVEKGTYLCRRCGLALFRANSQFHSGCGWPSFECQVEDHVSQLTDADGVRTEIRCQRCDGHLGHLFIGEYFTLANRRYCVNALALDFVVDNQVMDSQEAIVAGGCFWGVAYYLSQLPGVLCAEVGYTGGHVNQPSYTQVCHGDTGHYEAVRVLFDHKVTDYHAVIQRFFEIHDPTQSHGQGADHGTQYQSAIFCHSEGQYQQAQALVQQLKQKGYLVVTRLLPAQPFWVAEDDHQDYYEKIGKKPGCHQPVARFS